MNAGRSFGTIKKRKSGPSGKAIGTIKFICFDGEGIDVNGEHRYVLFGVGNSQIENENGLNWTEILDFLYSHYEPGTAFCGFYLGYDFDRWLRTMPRERVERLITNEGREARRSKSEKLHGKILPVDMPNGWQINMLGKKMMEIRKRYCHCDIHYCKCPKGPWMRLCDSGPFFQASFLKVIDPNEWDNPVVSKEEYELIKKGKENRSSATQIDDEMRYYNRLENEILARVLTELNNGFQKMNIFLAPGQWYGPGQAAQQWLKKENVPTNREICEVVPLWFLEAARMSYFGGWFEIFMHGIIPESTYEYDINSAYPHIIRNLPCLLHGNYKRGRGNPPKNVRGICLVRARVSNYRKGRACCIGTMLHRDKSDRILRPTRSEGWYWKHEIDSARKAKFINKCHIQQWMTYEPCDCAPPMRRVANLYLMRMQVGKDTPLGKGAKLGYNSMYGKFAQSVGSPMFANPIYASLITAGCRTMITDAIASHPEGKWNVAMVATDAVFFLNPHPKLPISKKLGEWDFKERFNLTLFKPGVYWDDSARRDINEGRSVRFKSRGVSARDFSTAIEQIDMEFSIWKTIPPDITRENGSIRGWPRIKFTSSFAMVSCLQAIRRGKWELAGHVSKEAEYVQNANPYDKRIGAWPVNYDNRTIWRSEPWTLPLNDCISKPYQKRFGMEDPWSLDRQEMHGITPDGTIPDLIAEALGLRN